MRYIGDIYRPPGGWKSYLLQCTVGCSHNACTFCGMYKNKRYYVRPLKDILEDIDMAREHFTDFSSFPLGVPNVTRVFLCDGDAIAMDTEDLLTILRRLREAFPRLERVTTYAGPRPAQDAGGAEGTLRSRADPGLSGGGERLGRAAEEGP